MNLIRFEDFLDQEEKNQLSLLIKKKIMTDLDHELNSIRIPKISQLIDQQNLPFLESGDHIFDQIFISQPPKVFLTGLKSFDQLLDGGLISGEIVEFWGLSETGKTQMCHFLASQFACSFPEKKVLYIHNCGNFSASRIRDFVETMSPPSQIESILERIVCLGCFSCESLYHAFGSLIPNLGFLIVDSLAVLGDLASMSGPDHSYLGLRYLSCFGQTLKSLASSMQIPIVLVNNGLLTKHSDEKVKPALGQGWSYVSHRKFQFRKQLSSFIISDSDYSSPNSVSCSFEINDSSIFDKGFYSLF